MPRARVLLVAVVLLGAAACGHGSSTASTGEAPRAAEEPPSSTTTSTTDATTTSSPATTAPPTTAAPARSSAPKAAAPTTTATTVHRPVRVQPSTTTLPAVDVSHGPVIERILDAGPSPCAAGYTGVMWIKLWAAGEGKVVGGVAITDATGKDLGERLLNEMRVPDGNHHMFEIDLGADMASAPYTVVVTIFDGAGRTATATLHPAPETC